MLDARRKLGRDELLREMETHHRTRGGGRGHVELGFRGPHNRALVPTPP